jgi:putative inorganic carbon (HCO3(-)) transporter
MVVFALLTFGVTALAMTAVGWNGGKTPALTAIYAHLPTVLRGAIPGTPQGSIHPNELAGVLVLVAAPLVSHGIGLTQLWLRQRSRILFLQTVLALGVGVVALGGILLTQGRSGVAGAAVSLAILSGMLVWRVVRSPGIRSSVRTAVAVVYMTCVVAGAALITLGITRWVASGTTSDNLDTFASRLELWDRSIAMLQDFAFTGIGLGQFDRVLHALYVPLLNGPLEVVPHAHNLFLEYALELGIPGAVAMMFLVLAFFRQCFRASQAADPLVRWAGTGLAAGMLGYMVYGTVDAIAPGARAGIVLWIVLGLGAAVGNLARPSAPNTI